MAGGEGGVISISKVSRNVGFARGKLKIAIEKGLLEEVRYGRLRLYKLTSSGLASYKMLNLINKVIEDNIDEDKLALLLKMLGKLQEFIEGKADKIEIATIPSFETYKTKTELPSFARENPWLDILFARGRE